MRDKLVFDFVNELSTEWPLEARRRAREVLEALAEAKVRSPLGPRSATHFTLSWTGCEGLPNSGRRPRPHEKPNGSDCFSSSEELRSAQAEGTTLGQRSGLSACAERGE